MKRMNKMKKIQFIPILILISLMSACTNGSAASQSNTIVEAKLNEREEAILSTTSDQSFIYDFKVDSEHTKADVWIEKYEYGELVEEKYVQMSAEVNEKGSVLVTLAASLEDKKQTLINI